jgi:virulence-associated protein VagC
MNITTVFKNGPSTQAVRIPKEFRLATKEVWIERVHNGLLIREKPESWDDFFMGGPAVTKDFKMTRKQRKPTNRGDIFK